MSDDVTAPSQPDPPATVTPAGRQEAIARAHDSGRTVVGVFPIFNPGPILTALDVQAVEIWGPPGTPRGPEVGRLQAYVCALARNGLAFVASGGAREVDGFLYPHTCDSIQGLATQIPDFGGAAQPALRLRLPKGEDRPSARAYLRRELAHLVTGLEGITGRSLERDRLMEAMALHARIHRARATLLDGRARVRLGDRALYELLRRGEFLWPEDHLAELEAEGARMADAPVVSGVGLLLSGIVPEPMGLLDALSEAGAYVAADDFAAVGRRVVRGAEAPPPDDPRDPLDWLVDWFYDLPPCPTRASLPHGRLAHIDRIATRGRCQGMILQAVQFCEPELADVPALRRYAAERGLPFLVLDSELEAELSGRAVTRLEAFVEMVAARQGGEGGAGVADGPAGAGAGALRAAAPVGGRGERP